VLGLASYAGSTWIVSSYIANWWGRDASPNIFFPFVMMWGGVAQFIAGIKGFQARDNLSTVLHTMWGSFYISAGLVWFLQAARILPPVGLNAYFPELASWGVVLMVFTYICTIAALGRDLVLVGVIATQAFGATLAVGGWYGDSGSAVKAAAYVWMFSSLLATYRVAAFLFEENLGKSFLPIFRTRRHTTARAVDNGAGEPGVKRGELQATEGTIHHDTAMTGNKNHTTV
jgi:succinate-acetate transporter protein